MRRGRSGWLMRSEASPPGKPPIWQSGASNPLPSSDTGSDFPVPSGASSRVAMHRVMAGLVAAIAWAGLAVQFFATFSANGDLLATLWILARFFTVLTNLLVAVTMTAIAVGGRIS